MRYPNRVKKEKAYSLHSLARTAGGGYGGGRWVEWVKSWRGVDGWAMLCRWIYDTLHTGPTVYTVTQVAVTQVVLVH